MDNTAAATGLPELFGLRSAWERAQNATLTQIRVDSDQGPEPRMHPNGSMQPRFTLRHAAVGYILALVFAFNGLLTSAIDAGQVSGAGPFALCFGGQVREPVREQVPQQAPEQHNTSKCSCTLSCCCTGSLARNSTEIGVDYALASAMVGRHRPAPIARDVGADHPLHLRSPPVAGAA